MGGQGPGASFVQLAPGEVTPAVAAVARCGQEELISPRSRDTPRLLMAITKRRVGRPIQQRSKLGVWVDANGWSREELATRLGIVRSSANRLCSGVRRPSLELALKIEKLTGGAVPAGYWRKVAAHSKD